MTDALVLDAQGVVVRYPGSPPVVAVDDVSVQVSVAGSKIPQSLMPTPGKLAPPATSTRPSAITACPPQNC